MPCLQLMNIFENRAKKSLSPRQEKAINDSQIQPKSVCITSYTFHSPKGTHFFLMNMAGFLTYDLRLCRKRTPSQSNTPQWHIVPFFVNHSNGCCFGFTPIFPILLCFHRHHIANYLLVTINILPPNLRYAIEKSCDFWKNITLIIF